MKKQNRYIMGAIGIVLLCYGYLRTSAVEIQLNVHSGELRRRYTAFGFQTHISKPGSNAIARSANRADAGFDWLTVSKRSYSHQPCKEDYRTLFSCLGALIQVAGSPEESQEFVRSVLDELSVSRSLGKTTRHVVRVYQFPASAGPRPTLLELWQSTIQDPAFPRQNPLSERRTEAVPPNEP